MPRELPPTAGLPISPSELFAFEKPERFEAVLADLVGVSDTQLECSATACLVIALCYLKSLAPQRNKVVIPGYTCPLVAIAVAQAGLQVVVCDTAANTFDFDAQCLEGIVDEHTLALIPTHIGGLPPDTATAIAIARRHGAFVIEDAAQSLGAKINGAACGLSGDIGVFSLTCGKGLTIYQGGFLATNNVEWREGMRRTSKQLCQPNAGLELRRIAELVGYAFSYQPDLLQYSYGQHLRRWLRAGSPEQAVGDVFELQTELAPVGSYRRRVGCASARNFGAFLADNVARGRARARQLASVSGLTVLQEPVGVTGSWPFLTVVFDEAQACVGALDDLWMSGLGVTKLFIHALSGYAYLKPILPSQLSLPNAESFARRTLTIGNSKWLSDEDFEHICQRLRYAAGTKPDRNSAVNATL